MGNESRNSGSDIFSRLGLLVGNTGLEKLSCKRVILFGVGGVGGWCAECLVRSGIRNLTIVDSDNVDPTNINRQLPATVSTVDSPKVDVLRQRLLEINPEAEIYAVRLYYDETTADRFNFNDYDYVVDAIDSVQSKMLLIRLATSARNCRLFSSMGAARRLDPLRIKVSEFWKVTGCPLARALRDRFKRSGDMPRRKFKCVWSDEPLHGQPKGTSCSVTATFGMVLASLVINDILKSTECL